MRIVLFSLATLIFTSCYSSQSVLLKRPVEFPFVYYSVEPHKPSINSKETVTSRPQIAYWDAATNKVHYQIDSMYLFTGQSDLDMTHDAIRGGQGQSAINNLTKAIETHEENRHLVSLLHNNLAIAYLTIDKPLDAKFHIDQAGIINDNKYILRNARLITGIMQKKLRIIKYEKPKKSKQAGFKEITEKKPVEAQDDQQR